jgi:hypothetical protein
VTRSAGLAEEKVDRLQECQEFVRRVAADFRQHHEVPAYEDLLAASLLVKQVGYSTGTKENRKDNYSHFCVKIVKIVSA